MHKIGNNFDIWEHRLNSFVNRIIKHQWTSTNAVENDKLKTSNQDKSVKFVDALEKWRNKKMPCESICHFTIHNEISRVKASISQDVINERAKHSKPEFNPVERREFFNFLSGNIEFVRIPDKCRRIVCSQFPNILIFVWENNEKILILVDELVLKLIDGDGKLKVELYHRFDINTFSKWLEEIETGILKVSYFNDK